MIKKIGAVFLFFFSACTFAAPLSLIPNLACHKAEPTNSSTFCPSFKVAATCYCKESGLPAGMCQNMRVLYNRMMSVFGTIQAACKYQRYTSAQDCIDNWLCYMNGGVDSQNRRCSGTGKKCE